MLLTRGTSLCSVAFLALTSHWQLGCNQIRQSWSPQTHTLIYTHTKKNTYTVSGDCSTLISSHEKLFPAIEVAFSPAWEKLRFPCLSGQSRGWVKLFRAFEASLGPAFLHCLSIIWLQSSAILTGSPFSPHSFHPLILLLHLPSAVCFRFPTSHLKFLQSPTFPFGLTHDYWPIIPIPMYCICVCARRVSSWMTVIGTQRHKGTVIHSHMPPRPAVCSHRHLSLKAIHIRMGLRRDWLLNRAGTVNKGMRKWKCIYLSVKVKDSLQMCRIESVSR